MNRIVTAFAMISVLTVGLFAQEAKTKPETIKFTAKKVASGDTVIKGATSNTKLVMKMSMGEMGEQEMNQAMDAKETKTVTILEAKNGKITKFKVAYKSVVSTVKMESGMFPEPMEEDAVSQFDLNGNTFTFTIADGAVTVKDAEGDAVEGARGEYLKNAEAPEGKCSAWNPDATTIFEKREFTVGETVVIPQERATAMVPNQKMLGDDIKVKVTATLRSKKKVFGVECGVFDMVVNIEGAPQMPGGGGMGAADAELTMKLTGTMTVGVDNMWVYASKMNGPIVIDAEVEAQEMAITISGKGDVKIDVLNVYSKAKIEKKATK